MTDWFAKALEREMRVRDLETQAQLAEIVGKPTATISRWIRGVQLPAFKDLCEVADRLEWTWDGVNTPRTVNISMSKLSVKDSQRELAEARAEVARLREELAAQQKLVADIQRSLATLADATKAINSSPPSWPSAPVRGAASPPSPPKRLPPAARTAAAAGDPPPAPPAPPKSKRRS